MRTKEFKSHIKSMKMVTYRSTYDSQDFYDVQCDGYTVASVSLSSMGNLRLWPRFFRLNISVQRELMDHLLDYAATPVSIRKDQYWNVIIAQSSDDGTLTAYGHKGSKFFVETGCDWRSLANSKFSFTDSQIRDLTHWLRLCADGGDRLARIVELGKVLAPEVEK